MISKENMDKIRSAPADMIMAITSMEFWFMMSVAGFYFSLCMLKVAGAF